jgi:hypothetical protein
MRYLINLIEDRDDDVLKWINFPEYPPEVENHVREFVEKLLKLGYMPDSGTKRIAMISPDKKTVIKVPKCDRGIADNGRERRAYNEFRLRDGWIPMAACRIFYADEAVGVPMLMMRYVKPFYPKNEKRPRWVDCVDCLQVGYDHKGNLVAYDL